jgi:hypothetical protein
MYVELGYISLRKKHAGTHNIMNYKKKNMSTDKEHGRGNK